MECPAPPWVVDAVDSALDALHKRQTAPFAAVFADYMQQLRLSSDLQVRMAQLEKEGQELREENADLHSRLKGVDDARTKAAAAELDLSRAEVARLDREVSQLYKDKSRLLEELVSAGSEVAASRRQAQGLEAHLGQVQSKAADLQAQLSATLGALSHERLSREAAASEVAGALAAKEEALVEAERLKAEHAKLIRRLVELKENEVGRMNEINSLHEEALQQAVILRKEAAADREAAELIRARLVGSPLASAHPAAAQQPPPPSSPLYPPAQGGGGAPSAGRASIDEGGGPKRPPPPSIPSPVIGLKEAMGLPPGLPASSLSCQRVLPRSPYRSMVAHKGGCCSLSSQDQGHLLASCGMSNTVHLWDNSAPGSGSGLLSAPASIPMSSSMTGSTYAAPPASAASAATPLATLGGMTGAVNDVAFTCDGSRVIAAGADRSLQLWDSSTGQIRHTLTGHAAAVIGVAVGSLDAFAYSISEDRCIKVWDLTRGFCIRSLPCAKMPMALALADGSTVVTGHVDGTLCVWDVRQGGGGGGAGGPTLEVREHTQAICSLSRATGDSSLLVASRDNTVSLFDLRSAATSSTLRAHGLALGTIGSMGRGRCRVDMSADGRFVAAGATDGAVYVWDLSPPSLGKGGGGGGGGSSSGSSSAVALRHHREPVVAVSWSCDASVLASADKGGVVSLWSLVS